MSIMQIIVTGVALTLAGLGLTVWRRGKLADRLKTELDAAKAEKSRLAEEVRNAQIKKNTEDFNRTLSDDNIDERLQSKGYYRD